MTTIVDIAEQIDLKSKKTILKNNADKSEWKPEECTDYVLPPCSIPDKRSKKTTRIKLSRVLAFIDSIKYTRLAHGCTIMPISSTNKRMKKICGSQRNASNLIGFMIKIGLLEVEDQHYQFNASIEKYNKSKRYRYYYENEEKIIEYCRNNEIVKYEIRNIDIDTVVEKFIIDDFDDRQVRFNSKLHIKKPDEFSVASFERYLKKILYRNYPQLVYYQHMADYINETYYADDPNLEINFTPHFVWDKTNKYIEKIGIRATNTYVSAKKHKDTNNDFSGYYKEDILDRYGLNLEKDVNSSVPRITLSLNTGKWISEDIDIYKLIYDRYIKTKCERENVSAIVELQQFQEVRSAIKKLHMRAYFDKENRVGPNTRYAMAEVKDKAEVDEEMSLFRDAVIAAEGGYLYDSEIFFHESCIYLEVLKDLLDAGYKVWQCYDAWYAAKDGVFQEEFETYVAELVTDRANKYIQHRGIEIAA